MTMSLQKELERRKEEEEFARLDEIEFLFPGYRAVDEALNRLKESAQKGFTVGTFEGEDHHRASHVTAHNFGVAFGQGTLGFRDYAARGYQVDLSEREADGIRKAWLRRFEGVARWHEQTAAYLRDGYAIETAAGRMARKADLAGNALQQALAFQIQGTEAEIMLRALAAMYPVLREHGALLGLFSHDEIIVEVEDDAETVAAVSAAVEGAIADAFRHYFPDATVEGLVEVRAVTCWADAK